MERGEVRVKTHEALEAFEENLAEYQQDPENEDLDPLSGILELTEYKTVHVLLSWGGPSSWLDIQVDKDGEIDSIVFGYAWWSEPVELAVDRDSAVGQFAADVIEFQGYGG